ncbi:MAG: tyrosine-type recombinase/integrase [Micromonosporaceae bacterium]
MARKPNGASSIYKAKDGWHGRVTVGVRDDGRPDRRHVRGKTEREVIKKVRALELLRDQGSVPDAGQRWTVAAWLTHWLENIATGAVTDNTLSGYRAAIKTHLIPGVGAHKLAKLQPEHLERLYRRMQEQGSKPATAHQAHRTVRAALNEAVRRKHIASSPAALAKSPRISDEEVEPYSVDEVRKILSEATELRNSTRWAIALALGLRQGEALGLKWSDVDLKAGSLTVRRALQRPRWTHGCGEPCGRKIAGSCPDRKPARAATADTKSRAGRRVIGVPDELVALLKCHKQKQNAERLLAGQLWQDGDWVFATPTGEAINPRTDYSHWKRLLREAGVRDGRLHDARHTAATVLLLLGVPERAVMGIMGWSNSSMAVRYQHLTATIRRDIARRVGGLLWQSTDQTGNPPDDDPGLAGVRVPA